MSIEVVGFDADGAIVVLPPEIDVDDVEGCFQSILRVAKRDGISPDGYDNEHDPVEGWMRYASSNSKRSAVYQVWLSRHWLSQCRYTERVDKSASSYGLKHQVERFYDFYVSNGAFLIAAHMLPAVRAERVSKQSLNGFVNIAQRGRPTRGTA
ncbi:hypothetical protein [Mesorhizobium sp.]|uniref:hypothetical protein n=1 Tax=Mesorhizobium sp. TaxID=1871066 RepID=UPI000FE6B52C|nr:hypothetical protein [Mesorhizobium sp.]RWM57444.1 MAG: hypothetical protein EOR78_09230 [Mesorhizobium sp.]RWM59076.1 MAG: hypothetical protein EOR79_12200 [Mesorhizobium sp.]RWM99883.1 MAG: hypothetical protein EOR85_18275 [Mesorhizobium sp.]TIO70364.1 MAG: hypothetical protein E5X85_07485 [Mesorhizobium sp.]TIR01527.1 MAG: hypothetical protein E5X64_28605 [Mesorhizobium sp.]